MSKAPAKNEIELQLSETHFFQLLDLIYLGNWMVTACSGGEDEHAQEYTDVEKQMFSHAEPFLEKGPFHTLNSEIMFTEEEEDSLQEARLIEETLQKTYGNKSAAADLLGISAPGALKMPAIRRKVPEDGRPDFRQDGHSQTRSEHAGYIDKHVYRTDLAFNIGDKLVNCGTVAHIRGKT